MVPQRLLPNQGIHFPIDVAALQGVLVGSDGFEDAGGLTPLRVIAAQHEYSPVPDSRR
jgi:hypothetical protein